VDLGSSSLLAEWTGPNRATPAALRLAEEACVA